MKTAGAVLLLLLSSVGLRAEIVEQILVKVNGEIFTKTDLEQRQVLVLRQRGQQIDLKSDPNNQQLRKALDEQLTVRRELMAFERARLAQRTAVLDQELREFDERRPQLVDELYAKAIKSAGQKKQAIKPNKNEEKDRDSEKNTDKK